jgi:hypothetical protein
MGWLWAAISGAFSGLVQGFLGLFGMSSAQKLGRAQVTEADQAETIKELSDGKAIETKVFSQPAGAADHWLHEHVPKD